MLKNNDQTCEIKISTHQPNNEKADMLEATARGYEILWRTTGKKCYEDSMKNCLADARDYRSCGFIRSVGAHGRD